MGYPALTLEGKTVTIVEKIAGDGSADGERLIAEDGSVYKRSTQSGRVELVDEAEYPVEAEPYDPFAIETALEAQRAEADRPDIAFVGPSVLLDEEAELAANAEAEFASDEAAGESLLDSDAADEDEDELS